MPECSLSSLPSSITQCVRLQRLWVSENHLPALPEGMASLSRLSELYVQVWYSVWLYLSTSTGHLEQPHPYPAGIIEVSTGGPIRYLRNTNNYKINWCLFQLYSFNAANNPLIDCVEDLPRGIICHDFSLSRAINYSNLVLKPMPLNEDTLVRPQKGLLWPMSI